MEWAASCWAALDERILHHIRDYLTSVTDPVIGQVIGEERNARRDEVKQAIEAERRAVDAKLAALEERLY